MTHMSAQKSRQTQLQQWLSELPASLQLNLSTRQPASSDASFRHYERIQADQRTLIIMDAPPAQEDCRAFVDITKRLSDVGLHVPEILAQNIEQGFLLLSDLGHQTYYDAIQQGLDETTLQKLYLPVLDALVTLQTANSDGLPIYDESRLVQELQLFTEWYVNIHHNTSLTPTETQALATIFSELAASVASQPRVLVHRDFHSPNLMIPTDAQTIISGIIDYQDAVHGAISYDLASLVFDARTTWEEPQQLDWAIRYWEKARAKGLPVPDDFAVFHAHYEWTGLQRNLRILGVFARLHHRDQKSHYLNHIPRVVAYVRQVARRYRPFGPLLKLLDRLEGTETTTLLTF